MSEANCLNTLLLTRAVIPSQRRPCTSVGCFHIKKRTVKSVGFENSPFAGNRNRTGTAFKLPRDFKSLVSTYSTIPADFFIL